MGIKKEYCVGDEARVRSWQDLVDEYGVYDDPFRGGSYVEGPFGRFYLELSGRYCGEVGFITRVSTYGGHRCYFLNDDNEMPFFNYELIKCNDEDCVIPQFSESEFLELL